MYLGISCPLKHPCLNPECLVIVRCRLLFPIDVAKLLYPVDMSVILPESVPLLLCQEFLDVRILVNVVIQRHQRACIIKLCHTVTAVNKIRIFAACNQRADCLLCRLACKPCLFYLCTDFFRNHLLNLIVIINL